VLQNQRIAAVLSLDRTLDEMDVGRLGLKEVASIPLEDAIGNDARIFLRAVDALERLEREHKRVLVQCHAGRSRSAVVVAGYLMKSLHIDAEAALEQVGSKRQIAVTTGLERLLEHLT
jgi:protein-tyrosine phosphatase